jgi:hypothetical protein
MHRRLLVAALTVSIAIGAAPSPERGTAADGRATLHPVLLGLLGGRERFDGLTGQHTRVGHVIAGFGQGPVTNILAAMGEVPMLGIQSGGSLTSHDIAQGRGDTWLAEVNQAVAAHGGIVYIRPFPEMNGHWNAYCAFNQDGSSRGASNSTAAFRKAFARVYLIVHGGPAGALNAKLRRLGLPPARTGELATNPRSRVRVVWNPQGYGSPDVGGNSAAAYYPGDAYVDVVGDDLYDIRGHGATWAAAEKLYKAHPTKAFAFPEWGLWGFDDPQFVRDMAKWVRTHRRTEFVAYYSGRPGSVFDLAAKPRSRAAYRSLITPLG